MTEQTALAGFPKEEFYAAAAYGKVKTISRLLPRLPGYPNNMEGEGFKIFVGGLTWAAVYGHVDVTRVMLAKLDADQVLRAVTALGGAGWSAMTLAAAHGRADVMTVMLAKLDTGDQVLTAVTASDVNGRSAMIQAAAYGRADVTTVMLERLNTSDQVLTAVTAQCRIGWSAMTWTAARGHANVMTVMLAKLDTSDQVLTAVTASDGTGLSAMTWAAARGHANVMMTMVTAAQGKGAGAAQIAEMFLRKDGGNKNAIERMDQETFAAVWEKLPKEVQGQLIADPRFLADKKTSVPVGILHAAFAEVAALQKRVAELEAAAQGKPPAGNAGQGNGDSPKLGQGQ